MERRSKLMDLREAAKMVTQGHGVALGGFLFHNRPAALVREIIKNGIGDLSLFSSPTGSYEIDLLIGVGLVKRLYIAHVSFEHLGLAPNFRKVAEKGEIEIIECDEATLIGGYMATIEGIPYHPISSLKGTDLLKHSPLTRSYISPFGEELIAVKALSPDIAILHAQEGDEFGNIRYLGASMADRIIAKASKKVIVSVDRLVSHKKVLKEPHRTILPSYLVDSVAEVPYGAHPSSSHGLYLYDESHLLEYITAAEASRKGEGDELFHKYLERYVFGPSSHFEYLERIGGIKTLAKIDIEKG